MKKFSHASYLYGLFFFSLETCFWVEGIIASIFKMIRGTFDIIDYERLWIISMFVYTYLYFAYHIYYPNTEKTLEMVKQRIQFYSALGSTISFLMLLFFENYMLKIFVVGTMMEYTWLQYLITEEINSVKRGVD